MPNILLNLIVIRSIDIDRAAHFYGLLGLSLTKHRHGNGPFHYSADLNAILFEIYPRKNEVDSTAFTRMGFRVDSVDTAVAALQNAGARVVSAPEASEWGMRAVVEDPDGHRIELTQAA